MVHHQLGDIDYTFDRFFWALKYLYWYLPIHPYRRFVAPVSKTTMFFATIWFYFVLVSQIFLLFMYCLSVTIALAQGGDFLVTSATMVWLILDINAIQSLYFSWNSWKEMGELFQVLHDVFPKTPQEKDAVDAITWEQRWTYKMKVQTVVFIMAVLGMVSIPLMKSILEYFIEGVWRNQLPMSLWTPFDAYVWPYYPWVYLLETWLYFVNTWIIVAVEAIMGAVTMLVCLEFKRVAIRFRSIPYGNFKNDIKEIKDAIEYHNLIQNISLKMRQVFSMALFCVFVVSSMVICLFLFLIINERGIYARLQYTMNLVCYLIYCSVYGYYGNEVIEHVSG